MTDPRPSATTDELAKLGLNPVPEDLPLVLEETDPMGVIESARSMMLRRAARRPRPTDSGPIQLT